jgi:hypothetical protein
MLKLQEKENERISNELFDVENIICEEIQEFYGDVNDIDLISSEWGISEGMVFMIFKWNDIEMKLWNDNGKAKLDGCPKYLKNYLKNKDCIKEFVSLDLQYYNIDEGFLNLG